MCVFGWRESCDSITSHSRQVTSQLCCGESIFDQIQSIY
ncbi:hypothetical protein Hamer_G002896 [Homarus americanus]|uniref:Uncharacterized protein n=2 Tax=Homarus americanus TaxID=6706 RepID=A0A8J5MUD7_HOMAM|nr:hypothetical protein Hamer_G002896 [Homarus americanus]